MAPRDLTDLNVPMVLTDPIRHYRDRGKKPVTLAVIHCMAERITHEEEKKIYEAPAWLRKLGLSVHAMIRPDGTVIECVPPDKMAWHAKGFNTVSLGCEILIAAPENQGHSYESFLLAIGIDPITNKPLDPLPGSPYCEEQYKSAGWWFASALSRQAGTDRSPADFQGHEDLSPKRKFDPGPLWDWKKFHYWFDRFNRNMKAGLSS